MTGSVFFLPATKGKLYMTVYNAESLDQRENKNKFIKQVYNVFNYLSIAK